MESRSKVTCAEYGCQENWACEDCYGCEEHCLCAVREKQECPECKALVQFNCHKEPDVTIIDDDGEID